MIFTLNTNVILLLVAYYWLQYSLTLLDMNKYYACRLNAAVSGYSFGSTCGICITPFFSGVTRIACVQNRQEMVPLESCVPQYLG